MDKSKVQEIVETHLPRLQAQLPLTKDWELIFEYGPLDQGNKGESRFDYAYEIARISINPEEHDDETDLVRTLRHELIHLLLAPVDAHLDIVGPLIDPAVKEATGQSARVAIERCVLYIERVLDRGEGMPAMMPTPEDPESISLVDQRTGTVVATARG